MSGTTHHVVEAPAGVQFDVTACLDRIATATADAVRRLGRQGAVVAVSGGVDSGVTAGICTRALGPAHVVCLWLPERDVSPESERIALELAQALGARVVEEPMMQALDALGCYRRRDEAIRRVFPEYEPNWRHKIVRSPPTGGVIVFSLVVERPDGTHERRRMPSDAYRDLLAASNMKQRLRKLLEYTWADRLSYAVVGTPNLLEYDQGFFVKGGDGLADIKPIAHLFKSQVFALARELGLPGSVMSRDPSTDTFSLPQTQEEFYFGHPYERMDLLVWGYDNDIEAFELARRVGLETADVEAAYREISRRRVATAYLHAPGVVFESYV